MDEILKTTQPHHGDPPSGGHRERQGIPKVQDRAALGIHQGFRRGVQPRADDFELHLDAMEKG